jgi:hypothetical protein
MRVPMADFMYYKQVPAIRSLADVGDWWLEGRFIDRSLALRYINGHARDTEDIKLLTDALDLHGVEPA